MLVLCVVGMLLCLVAQLAAGLFVSCFMGMGTSAVNRQSGPELGSLGSVFASGVARDPHHYEYEDVSPRVYPISLTATFTPDPLYIVYSAAMSKLSMYYTPGAHPKGWE